MGGTRQYGSSDPSPDPHDAVGVWDRATSLMPSLAEAEIIDQRVGFRPHRGGGVRLEKEVLCGGKIKVEMHFSSTCIYSVTGKECSKFSN